MANKLREVFNKDESFIKGTIRFKNTDAFKEFEKALEAVERDGETVWLDGVESISTGIASGVGSFPLEEYDGVSRFVIGPNPNEIVLNLVLGGEKVEFPVVRYSYKTGMRIRTTGDFPFDTTLEYDAPTGTASVSVKPILDRAADVDAVLFCVSIEIALLEKLMSVGSARVAELDDFLDYLHRLGDLFEQMKYVEETFNRRFVPSSIDLDNIESVKDLVEVCLLIRDHKVLRTNTRKVSVSGNTLGFPSGDVNVGQRLVMTFIRQLEYSLWGEKIEINCAALLGNAVVKEILDLGDGQTRVVYGDSDERPMYVSFRGFITEREAEEELDQLMEHLDEYENAMTVVQYMQEGC